MDHLAHFAGTTSASRSMRGVASTNPRDGSLRVEGTLPMRTSPVASSISMASVKVPLMSIPNPYAMDS